jgi:hypothetical protein
MTVWVLVFAATVFAGGLRVETQTPAALCPDIGEVRRAVHDRLSIEGAGEWLAMVDLVHRPEGEAGDVVRVELRDPASHLRLHRDLPRSDESCVALTQTVALVLESFFRRPTEQPPDGGSRAPAVIAAAPPAPAIGWGPAVDLLGRWALGPTGPALILDLWYGGPAPAWAFGLEGAWMATEQQFTVPFDGGQGTATVRSAVLRGWFARRVRAAAFLEILVGPELALAVDRMATDAALGGMANVRAAGGGGARAHLRFRLAPRTTLSLLAAFDVTPRAWAGQFTLEGLPGELAPAPDIRLSIAAGLGFGLFP